MRVLLTGATGLIGKEVGKRLVRAGHEVNVVSRDPHRAFETLPFPARIFPWKGESEPLPPQALDGVHGIIHLAGEPIAAGRWTEERKKKIRASRVQGTRRIVDAIGAHPQAPDDLKVFVLGSGMGYYGSRGDEALREDSPKGDGFLSDLVEEWENELRALKGNPRTSRIRAAMVRTGLVMSRRSGALAKMLPLFTRGLGGKLATGQQWMSWIHIEDIARVFLFALENSSVEGPLNATAPEPARNERFTVSLARAVDRPVFLPVPETALRLALGEMAGELLGSLRVLPQKLQDLGFEFRYPDLVPALEELGETLRGGHHEVVSELWMKHAPIDSLDRKIEPPMGKSLFRKWVHLCETEKLGDGTLVRDRVIYKLPPVLDAAAAWRVNREIESSLKSVRQGDAR